MDLLLLPVMMIGAAYTYAALLRAAQKQPVLLERVRRSI